jgi:hypothetical protein
MRFRTFCYLIAADFLLVGTIHCWHGNVRAGIALGLAAGACILVGHLVWREAS